MKFRFSFTKINDNLSLLSPSSIAQSNLEYRSGIDYKDDIPIGLITAPSKDYPFNLIDDTKQKLFSFVTIMRDRGYITRWGNVHSEHYLNIRDKETGESVFTEEDVKLFEDIRRGKIFNADFQILNQNYPAYMPNFEMSNGYGSGGRYADVMDYFTGFRTSWINNTIVKHVFRSFTCYVGKGIFGCNNSVDWSSRTQNPEFEILCMVTIKPEYIEYVSLCMAMKEDIHPDVCTIWVKKGFDHKSFPHKGLRSMYRKNLLKPAKAAGITIRELDKIKVTQDTKSPAEGIRIPSKRMEAIKDAFKGMLDTRAFENNLRNIEINLV